MRMNRIGRWRLALAVATFLTIAWGAWPEALYAEPVPCQGLDEGLVSVCALASAPSAQPAREQQAAPVPAQVPSAAPVQIPGARLRFDGLYQGTPETGDYFYWMRFYPDGTVLAVSSTGNLEQVSQWLAKGSANLGTGTIEREGLSLKFSSRTSYGVVDYWGTIGVDVLDLESLSHINGFHTRRLYRFQRVAGW